MIHIIFILSLEDSEGLLEKILQPQISGTITHIHLEMFYFYLKEI